jgi:hypothetical protein
MWAVRILSFVAIAVSLLCLISLIYFLEHKASMDWPLAIMLSAMAIGFGIAGGKPRNWQPWTYFYANNQGLHFPSNCPANAKTKWLTVPWQHVGEIKKQKLYKGATGVSLELLLNPDEIDQFFKDVNLTQSLLGIKPTTPYFTVGYSNSFKDPDQAVTILNAIKQTGIT